MDQKEYQGSAKAVKATPIHAATRDRSFTNSLGRVYGWVALGLLVTAVVAFALSLLFAHFIGPVTVADDATAAQKEAAQVAMTVYLAVLITSGLLVFILSIVFSLMMAKHSKKALGAYFFYTALMGVTMSSLLITGIDFYTLGVAFALTAGSFALMSLWGIKSKKNLNILGLVSLILLSSVFFSFLFYFIMGLATGNGFFFYIYDWIATLVVDLVVVICCAVDSYNMRKSLQANPGDAVVEAAWAFTMYTDFIWLFVRVVLLLAAASGSRK